MGRKPVKTGAYNLEGYLVGEFESIRAASKAVGSDTVNLANAMRLGIKCLDMYWLDITQHKPLRIEVRKYRRGGKKVRIYTAPGKKFVKEASCLNEVKDITGLSVTTIRTYAKNAVWHKSGYFFEFVNEEDKHNRVAKFDGYKRIKRTGRRNHKTPVALIKDGERLEFESVMEAARKTGVNDKSILHVLAGRYNTAGGYQIERL